jgi:hypothetical protein
MASMTITEALAEIKTIGKRIVKKRDFIGQYVARNDAIRDPFEKDGGSAVVMGREMQALADLELRIVRLRLAIQEANHRIEVTVQGVTKTLAAWLTWRKEVAPGRQQFCATLRQGLAKMRKDAQAKGLTVGAAGAVASVSGAEVPQNITVNLDEKALAEESEQLETILGELDGQLSLKNATELITIPD